MKLRSIVTLAVLAILCLGLPSLNVLRAQTPTSTSTELSVVRVGKGSLGITPSVQRYSVAELASINNLLGSEGRSRKSNAMLGALIGGTATAFGLLVYLNASSGEKLFSPLVLAPVVVAGALIGAGVGALFP